MKRVLITGGAGFIGSRLALRLVERGDQITVLDNLSPQIHTDNPEGSALLASIRDRVRFVRGDVTRREDLLGVIDGQEIIVHLAAETGTGQSMYQVDRYCRVNIGGTSLLLDLLATGQHSVKRLVVASSRAVYGEGKYLSASGQAVYPEHRADEDMRRGEFEVKSAIPGERLTPVATDEESKLHPSSVYGITKQVQEQLVMTVCPALGIEPVAFRYQNVFGPGQSLANPYTGILSIFSNLIMSGRPINIFEDGLESRDFVFVEDVVTATVLGMEHPAAAGEVFNVGSGRPVDVRTVAQTLVRLLGRNVRLEVTGNYRVGDIRHNYASLEKIRALLGFVPEYGFEQGIERFCGWVQSMGVAHSDYEGSLAELRARGLMK